MCDCNTMEGEFFQGIQTPNFLEKISGSRIDIILSNDAIILKKEGKAQKMRLTGKEIEAINESFRNTFRTGSVTLFGSRTHNDKRGGDIDLYIETSDRQNLARKKIDFLVTLKRRIGERKIDVVIGSSRQRPIDEIAKKEGIELCRY